MQAIRLTAWERPARLVEVPVPEPGPGEVLVRVAGGRALPLRPASDALARRSAAVRAAVHARPRGRRHRRRARPGSRRPRAGRAGPRLRAVGLRPLPLVQRRSRASLRAAACGARRGPRPRRRPGGVRGRALAPPHRAARRARPGRRGAAGRRGADALPRDPSRAGPAATGNERDRHRRRRARPRRRPAPEGARARRASWPWTVATRRSRWRPAAAPTSRCRRPA